MNKKLSYMRSKSAERFARKQEVLLIFHDDLHHGVVVDGGDVEDEHQAGSVLSPRSSDVDH